VAEPDLLRRDRVSPQQGSDSLLIVALKDVPVSQIDQILTNDAR